MDFDAKSKTIDTIFSISKQYTIPRFQRPYSWGQEEIEELWRDIVSNIKIIDGTFENQEYFIGSLVLIGNDDKFESSIVDGQQRLTTITILLSALIETFNREHKDDLLEGLYGYIEGKDLSNNPYFKLKKDTSSIFFTDAIQYKIKKKLDPENEEEKALNYAYNFFINKLERGNLSLDFKIVSNADIDTTNDAIYIYLLQIIRNQILKLKVVYITVSNEDDAYAIFETLNARGLSLSSIDLIKNEMFKILKDTHPSDFARLKWRELQVILTERRPVDLNEFFKHYWSSRYGYTPEDKLYKNFKKLISGDYNKCKSFLEQLVDAAELYNIIIEPTSTDWNVNTEKDIYYSLLALNQFNIRTVRTLLLTVFYQFKNKKLNIVQVREILNIVERFHFIFSAVCASRASGLETKYSRYARKIMNCKNKTQVNAVIRELKEDLKSKLPDRNTFTQNFNELWFTNNRTKDKKLIQYIFRKYEKYLQHTGELETSFTTLEHIKPQSEVSTCNLVGCIGNLLPLSEKINNDVDVKPFAEKVIYFEGSQLETVKEFVKKYKTFAQWENTEIKTRTDEIAVSAYDTIWNL